jgi:subtilisin family serine protease
VQWLRRLFESIKREGETVAEPPNQPPGGHSSEPHSEPHAQPGNATAVISPIPPDLAKVLDPNLGLAWALIGSEDWSQLKSRTGIDQKSARSQSLPLFIELGPPEMGMEALKSGLKNLNLDVPDFYFKELQVNKQLTHVTARIALMPGDPSQIIDSEGNPAPLDAQLFAIMKSSFIRRISIAQSHHPCLEESIKDIGLLPTHGHKGHVLRGNGVIVGIIDDGCAFAHRNFLNVVHSRNQPTYMTRVLHLWDQSITASASDKKVGWIDAQDYGREVDCIAINKAIAGCVTQADRIEEDAIYAHLNYQVGAPGDLSSHGTHVMDIAAGNGKSLMGFEGVAPEAEIIFVQLPEIDIENPGPVLDKHIVDGVAYIFRKAGNKPVVVNISFGGHSGAHDGTSDWESGIDQLLTVDNRAVVVSAGNGFEAECHACGTLRPGQERSLGWIVKPVDPTPNDVEIWYDGGATLTISLTEPDTRNVYGPYPMGTNLDIQQPVDNKIIGHVSHSTPIGGSGDSTALIALRPTSDESGDATHTPARSGIWTVTLKNTAGVTADFHAWIRRDDIGRYGRRRQQSRFVPEDVYPGFTIGDFATGKHTIAVGAYNTSTDEVSRYSACGPTRPSLNLVARKKPDICAPAEEDAAGRGVLSASSLRAQPTRLSGTSASAPHVTGLVALILEYSTQYGTKTISADEIRDNLALTGKSGLKYNGHQEADDSVKIKQRDVWTELVGGGKVDFSAAMNNLFP